MNDADLEMLEMAAQGDMIANGVCPLCEDILDPFDPRWSDEDMLPSPRLGRRCTRQEMADMLGPIDHQLGWHVDCANTGNRF